VCKFEEPPKKHEPKGWQVTQKSVVVYVSLCANTKEFIPYVPNPKLHQIL